MLFNCMDVYILMYQCKILLVERLRIINTVSMLLFIGQHTFKIINTLFKGIRSKLKLIIIFSLIMINNCISNNLPSNSCLQVVRTEFRFNTCQPSFFPHQHVCNMKLQQSQKDKVICFKKILLLVSIMTFFPKLI